MPRFYCWSFRIRWDHLPNKSIVLYQRSEPLNLSNTYSHLKKTWNLSSGIRKWGRDRILTKCSVYIFAICWVISWMPLMSVCLWNTVLETISFCLQWGFVSNRVIEPNLVSVGVNCRLLLTLFRLDQVLWDLWIKNANDYVQYIFPWFYLLHLCGTSIGHSPLLICIRTLSYLIFSVWLNYTTLLFPLFWFVL